MLPWLAVPRAAADSETIDVDAVSRPGDRIELHRLQLFAPKLLLSATRTAGWAPFL